MKKKNDMKGSYKTSGIIMAVCEVVIGILLLVNPVGFTRTIITFLGAILLLFGIVKAIQYFRSDPQTAIAEQKLTRGLIQILLGVFFIANSGWVIATFPLLTMLYGVGVLVTGTAKVQLTIDMIRVKNTNWFFAAISTVLTIVCALIILCNPFGTTAVLWMFIAVTLIIEAIVDLLAVIFTKKQKQNRNETEEY